EGVAGPPRSKGGVVAAATQSPRSRKPCGVRTVLPCGMARRAWASCGFRCRGRELRNESASPLATRRRSRLEQSVGDEAIRQPKVDLDDAGSARFGSQRGEHPPRQWSCAADEIERARQARRAAGGQQCRTK